LSKQALEQAQAGAQRAGGVKVAAGAAAVGGVATAALVGGVVLPVAAAAGYVLLPVVYLHVSAEDIQYGRAY
jgi:hypothetical protein